MTAGIYINCRKYPFIDWIIALLKTYETRKRDMLHDLVGQRVAIIETGKGKRPMVRAMATVTESVTVPFHDRAMREAAMIFRTEYDIIPKNTKVFYKLENVEAVKPYPVPENRVNHGRSWTEF